MTEESEQVGGGTKGEGEGGGAKSCRALWAVVRTLAFTLKKVGAIEESRQKKDVS